MQVKVEIGGVRLDKAVADLTSLSRSHANEQIKNGQILVNGQVKKAKYAVKAGDVIIVQGLNGIRTGDKVKPQPVSMDSIVKAIQPIF